MLTIRHMMAGQDVLKLTDDPAQNADAIKEEFNSPITEFYQSVQLHLQDKSNGGVQFNRIPHIEVDNPGPKAVRKEMRKQR